MAAFYYTPDKDIKVHEEGAIKLLCKPFQSHENGLPEWAKNAADEYARRDLPKERRVVVIILQDSRKGLASSLSCLDFAGMTSKVIEDHFRQWADPDAARQGKHVSGVQGGHGNGGKCYMTQMFEQYSLLHTALEGKANRYGVQGGAIRFGYIPNREAGRDFAVEDTAEELEASLAHTGYKVAMLPTSAKAALKAAQGFTLVTGVGPRGYEKRIPASRLLESLQEHPQMLLTLQLCEVYVLHNGRPITGGQPLSLPEIEPMTGAEQPRTIAIPEALRDPVTNNKISTTDNNVLPTGELILRTSHTSMRWSKKTRHSVVYQTKNGFIGYVPVPELDIQSPYRDRIHGVCHLESLEPYKQNDRARLAESPLTRAVGQFIAHSIQEYAKEFEYRDKRQHDKKEKDAISRLNEALDKWKNRFLHTLMQGMWGDSGGGGDGGRGLSKGVPARLELSVSKPKLGKGVALRPALKFFDTMGKRIRPVPVDWTSEDMNVAAVDDLGILTSFSYGSTTLYAETCDGKVRSNRIPLDVVRIHKIVIVPEEIEVTVGGRQGLRAICDYPDGRQADNVSLIWTESNPTVARVSAAGIVFGFHPGEVEVSAGDDAVMAEQSAVIRVVEGGRKGKKRGRGFPKVLVSGDIDPDPDTGEYVNFSAEDPPIWQRTQDFDRNVWWINSAAPLAKLYLNRVEGYGYETREWRMYHLERYIDVIVQIAMTYGPDEPSTMSSREWILKWGSHVAEIQAAAASDLATFIASGEMPEDK